MNEPELKRCVIAGVEATVAGTEGPPLVILGGPPTSSVMFREVQRRLAPRATVAPELLSGDPPLGIEALSERLGQVVAAVGADTVLAHGLAIPLALRAEGVSLALLSNGPIASLDPITRSLAAMPLRALRAALRPALVQRWLASSAGLRRAVVNPYVMDRDTVAMLSEPLLADRQRREATARWIRGLPEALAMDPVGPRRIGLIWGMSDALYQVSQADKPSVAARVDGSVHIPGGRWLHPEERPWALAEGVLALLDERRDPLETITVT